MFQNWLKPIEPDAYCLTASYTGGQIGTEINSYVTDLPNIEGTNLAIIGIDHVSMDKVRKHLYAFRSINAKIVDLGNKANADSSSLIQVFGELIQNNTIPIFIGQSEENAKIFFKTYSTLKDQFNACLVEQKIPYPDAMSNYFEALEFNHYQNLNQLGVIGGQSHFSRLEFLEKIKAERTSYCRLGEMRKNFDVAEPVLRDADFLCFNLEAIRYADVPGHRSAYPSGLTAEEACQVMRLAGISDRVSSVGIFGYDNRYDTLEQTAKLISEMIWYFMEAYCDRKKDYPINKGLMQQFVVDLKDSDVSLNFWKSAKSGRWWLEVPGVYSESDMVSCSYKDYKMACSEEISPELMKLIEKS